MIKIANIVPDDKFIDGVMYIHSMVNDICQHEYIMVTDDIPHKFKYIKNWRDIHLIRRDDVLDYLNHNGFDAVFLHCLFSAPLLIIPQICEDIVVCWFAWGHDIYGDPDSDRAIKLNLYKERTLQLIKTLYNIKVKNKMKHWIKLLINWEKLNGGYKCAINRVDYFSGVIPPEYDLMKKKNFFKAERIVYSYSNRTSLERYDSQEYDSCGVNIIVGNSAAPTNNHLDLLPFLSRLDLGERKVYLPLSYSGKANYADKVLDTYKQELGESVVGLRDFIPYQDYASIVQSCGIGIYYHERQQAVGNVNLILRNGGKVFLSETSVLYSYYKQLGTCIYSVQKDLTQEGIDTPLTEEQRQNNRTILYKLMNSQTIKRNLLDIYNHIIDDRQKRKGLKVAPSANQQLRET